MKNTYIVLLLFTLVLVGCTLPTTPMPTASVPAPTVTETPTQPAATETPEYPFPTPTPITYDPATFVLRGPELVYTQYYKDSSCSWSGVGGRVILEDGSAAEDVRVVFETQEERTVVPLDDPDFGPGGYSYQFGSFPEPRGLIAYIESADGIQLSPYYDVRLSGQCNMSLTIAVWQRGDPECWPVELPGNPQHLPLCELPDLPTLPTLEIANYVCEYDVGVYTPAYAMNLRDKPWGYLTGSLAIAEQFRVNFRCETASEVWRCYSGDTIQCVAQRTGTTTWGTYNK